MGTSLQTTNATIVSAFKSALLHQGLIVLIILALVTIGWNILRMRQLRQGADDGAETTAASIGNEPSARKLLRIAFGCIWLFDGILQGQISMPLGLTSGVIQPAAASSPTWVRHLVNVGVTIWNNHPVPAAASAVWIQVGIGLWLLVAPRGNWSRLAGVGSACWGLVVWIFGEAFGSIFSPGLSWLLGAPGGVVFYIVAGVLIALPDRSWANPRFGRRIVRANGIFFLGMAVLQAWPGRGFWQGQPNPRITAGTLTAMVRGMAKTPQPGFLSSWVSSFASFDARHGWAVNLFVVIALATIGTALLSGRHRVIVPAIGAATVLCLADWVLIEDFGFLGGVGTDPNSMIPMMVIIGAGYVAMVRIPASVNATSRHPTELAPSWRERLLARPAYLARSLAAIGAIAVVLVGAAPMVLAATNPVADPIINEAIDGTPDLTDLPAAPFDLVDQFGRSVALRSLRGDAVAITFLDPVCTSDCPLIAQEFREADQQLGTAAQKTVFIAIVANPIYRSVAAVRAFDENEGLEHLTNWLYLTGSLQQLEQTWNNYGVQSQIEPAGAMADHSDIAYVIDPAGYTRAVLDADPGEGTVPMQSSFAGLIANEIREVLAKS